MHEATAKAREPNKSRRIKLFGFIDLPESYTWKKVVIQSILGAATAAGTLLGWDVRQRQAEMEKKVHDQQIEIKTQGDLIALLVRNCLKPQEPPTNRTAGILGASQTLSPQSSLMFPPLAQSKISIVDLLAGVRSSGKPCVRTR